MNWKPTLQGSGRVVAGVSSQPVRLSLAPTSQTDKHYHNAQIDDYDGQRRPAFAWRPGTRLTLQARFSHKRDQLRGTAGFGFWNAPYGRRVALPQAAWFFFASAPNNLPLNRDGVGRGWFASTIDAGHWRAKRLIPLAPFAVLCNQFGRIRQKIMPPIMNQLGVSFCPLANQMSEQHSYRLDWLQDGTSFYVDEQLVFKTHHSPRGPMGFICWIDNQYAILTPNGRFGGSILDIIENQWLEVSNLQIVPSVSPST